MNSKEYWGLMEAYSGVYDPEIRHSLEEKAQFENWVNSLVEEGYDLSDYTWEEVYEIYMSEGLIDKFDKFGKDPYGVLQDVKRSATGAAQSLGRQLTRAKDAVAREAQRRSVLSPRETPENKWLRTGSYGDKPARPAAAPAARPAAAPASSKPAPTSSSTSEPPKRTFNPLMQKTFGYQTGNAPDQQRARADAIVKSGAVAALKPSSTPSPSAGPVNRATGSKKPGSVYNSFDVFDLVKGHLLDEGYADTEDAAMAIMANMSEEWRNSILNNI